ncbi:MAG TPA: Gfo/Idh/MocA family oxidoreductase [Lacipirellulaceae bacterium]|nr:Gfo/Idh/MocA family oxidoreductase [Lacipirellulaceae bacterium]
MNLTPEEKEIGKQNFDEATGTTRREFLATIGIVGGTAAVAGIGAKYFHYGPKLDDRLRVGVIGTGDEGNVLLGALNPDYVDVVAIADIRPYSRHRAFYGDWYSPGAHAARPGLLKVYGPREGWKTRSDAEKHIKVYKDDYNELLDDPNVEAVIIAVPLHMHHPVAINAMRKGKHVLTEKLMAHDIGLCKEMCRVAAESKDPKGNPIILAVGHQRHYNILYDNAVEQIRQGLIGDVHYIRAQWHRGNLPGHDSWCPPLPGDKELVSELNSWKSVLAGTHPSVPKPSHPDEIAEWKAKIAQKEAEINDVTEEIARKHGYQTMELSELTNADLKKYHRTRTRSAVEELIRWRLWNRTGGGLMAELGAHQLDAASIFIAAQNPDRKEVQPLSVSAVGGRSIFPADRDCDDHVYCMFEFPAAEYYKKGTREVANPNKKIVVTYSSINGDGYGGYGEIVFGTKGTIILEREENAMLFKGSNTSTKIEVKPGKDGKPAMDTYETGGGAAVAQAATGGHLSRGYREEIEHWAWCIRNPAPEHKPFCPGVVGLADAVIALTSNVAMAKQTQIKFDPAWFDPARSETPEGKPPRQASEIKA